MWNRSFRPSKGPRCGAPCSPIARRSERAEIVPTLNGGVHKVRDQENHHERKFHLLQNSPWNQCCRPFLPKASGRTAETEAQRKRNGDIHTLVNGATAGKQSPGTGRGGADEPDQTRIRSSRKGWVRGSDCSARGQPGCRRRRRIRRLVG